MSEDRFPGWHGTTIVAVRKNGEVVIAGDGQVSLGQTVIKGTARKVRRIAPGGADVICGFAGSTARGQPRPAAARGGRAGEGLAHRQVPAQSRGDADRVGRQ